MNTPELTITSTPAVAAVRPLPTVLEDHIAIIVGRVRPVGRVRNADGRTRREQAALERRARFEYDHL